MEEKDKTKKQLLDELIKLQQRIAELEENEMKFRNIIENLPMGVHMYHLGSDGRLRFIDANPAADKILGVDNTEHIGKTIEEAFPEISETEIPKRFRKIAEKGGFWKKEDIIYKNGLIEGVFENYNFQTSPKKMVSLFRDITKRKRAEREHQLTLEKLRKAMRGTIRAVALTVETRDPYTAGHQQRVSDLARAIANEMGLSKNRVDGIRMAGLIHDIGKINVPVEILSKAGRLTELEFNLIKTHPQTGYSILKQIEFPWPVAKIILQHHERLDGSGYPSGLAGKKIVREARILGVADVVEAMSSHRPYRPALGIDKALEEISKNKGVLYYPDVVDACLRLFTEKDFKFRLSDVN